MTRYSNTNQNSRAETAKLCYSQCSKQLLIKINCYLVSRARWDAMEKMACFKTATNQKDYSIAKFLKKAVCFRNF